jgi:hypothetical protein
MNGMTHGKSRMCKSVVRAGTGAIAPATFVARLILSVLRLLAGLGRESCGLWCTVPRKCVRFTVSRGDSGARGIQVHIYRIYFQGSADEAFAADEFSAFDDESASQFAQRMTGGAAAELWCGNRLVKRWCRSKEQIDAPA